MGSLVSLVFDSQAFGVLPGENFDVLGILADNCSVTHVIACKSSKCGWLFLVQRWVSFAFLWFSGAVQRRVFCACYVLWSCMCKM